MKTLFPQAATALSVLLVTAATGHAAIIVENHGPDTVGFEIPDNQPVLTSFLHRITTSDIQSLTEVVISFELTGTTVGSGFASDMFASLLKSPVDTTPTAGDPSAVLLNRVGVGLDNPIGHAFDGWHVTLSDTASGDIHLAYQASGILTGLYQPDGRINPTDGLRPSELSLFNGGTGNGDWWFNIGDLSGGGTLQLVNWSLTLTGDNTVPAVPEAPTWISGVGLLALTGIRTWRRYRKGAFQTLRGSTLSPAPTSAAAGTAPTREACHCNHPERPDCPGFRHRHGTDAEGDAVEEGRAVVGLRDAVRVVVEGGEAVERERVD